MFPIQHHATPTGLNFAGNQRLLPNNKETSMRQSVPEGELIAIAVISILIGISYGLAYGVEYGNQLVYLPPGLILGHPDFLAGDWWATETSFYHLAFARLISILDWLRLLPWGLAIANVLIIALAYWFTFKLVHYLTHRRAFAVWSIFLFLFLGMSRSHSVAATYLFDAEFQPSSIATCMFVLALYYFVAGRMLISGIALAVAGLFHANFLLLGILCFGIAQLIVNWRLAVQCGIPLLGPSLLVLATQIPIILTISGLDLPPDVRAEAQRLLVEVAAPHHYQPRRFLTEFAPLIGWSAAGVACLMMIWKDDGRFRRFAAIYSSFLIILVVGTLLTTVVFVGFVSRLFVWRMAPFALMCGQLTIAIAAGHLIFDGAIERRRHASTFLLKIAGLGMAAPLAYYARRLFIGDLTVAIFAIVFSALAMTWYIRRKSEIRADGSQRASAVVIVVAIAGLAILQIPNSFVYSNGTISPARNFNLLGIPAADRARNDLYRWARTETAPESRFLIPPTLSGFRLHAERPVFVDWKGRPLRPDELVEWHRRIGLITGLRRWENWGKLDVAYDALNDDRIRSISKTFNIRYVVFRKTAGQGRCLENVVFENDKYFVVDLESPTLDPSAPPISCRSG
jgi:hypothetical protein